ncbi:MAG: flagellar export protein FliJ [Thermodesulfobacteriota bacterium]
MKRFRFRLEPLLRYREFKERQAQQKLFQAQTDLAESERRILRGSELFSESTRQLDEKTGAGITMAEYRLHRGYLSGIERALDMERRRRLKLIQTKEKRQQELAQKSKEKKLLEKLRDRKKEDYYQDVAEYLQKEIDDMVTVRKAREIVE